MTRGISFSRISRKVPPPNAVNIPRNIAVPPVETEDQAFCCAINSEKGSCQGIGHYERPVHAVQLKMGKNNNNACSTSDKDKTVIGDAYRRYVAHGDIADETSAKRGDPCADHNGKHVKLFMDGNEPAVDPRKKDAEVLDNYKCRIALHGYSVIHVPSVQETVLIRGSMEARA